MSNSTINYLRSESQEIEEEARTDSPLDKADSTGMTKLMHAAKEGNDEEVKVLIKEGAKLDIKGSDGRTALMHATHGPSIGALKALIDAGAKLDLQDSWDFTALIHAASWGSSVDAVIALIEAGANLNLQADTGYTALMCAVSWIKPEKAAVLIDAGADLSLSEKEYGNTALLLALKFNYKKNEVIYKSLIKAGAYLNLSDKYGCTPLMHAAMKGEVELVKLLSEAGADLNLSDKYGSTPLMYAAMRGEVELVKMLSEAGADLNLQDPSGRSALSIAISVGNLEIVEILVKSGVDANVYISPPHPFDSIGYYFTKVDKNTYNKIITTLETYSHDPIKYILEHNHQARLALSALNNFEQIKSTTLSNIISAQLEYLGFKFDNISEGISETKKCLEELQPDAIIENLNLICGDTAYSEL
jgi:ankyrin repeat protein